MFRIVKQPRAWFPVVWDGLDEDGNVVENRIEMRFLLLKVDAAAEFIRDVVAFSAKEGEPDVDVPQGYADLIGRISDDWRGVGAENGEPLPFTPENLRLLMNEGGMFTHVFNAFRSALAGQGKAREGN